MILAINAGTFWKILPSLQSFVSCKQVFLKIECWMEVSRKWTVQCKTQQEWTKCKREIKIFCFYVIYIMAPSFGSSKTVRIYILVHPGWQLLMSSLPTELSGVWHIFKKYKLSKSTNWLPDWSPVILLGTWQWHKARTERTRIVFYWLIVIFFLPYILHSNRNSHISNACNNSLVSCTSVSSLSGRLLRMEHKNGYA